MKIAKLIKLPLLIDEEEMASLCSHLPPFSIYKVQGVVAKGDEQISKEDFLKNYRAYLTHLKEGSEPAYSTLSPAWSVSDSLFNKMEVDEKRQLIKPTLPVVQLQPHNVSFSQVDGLFRSMVFGIGSLPWGVQFSYPTLFQNPQTHAIERVNEDFPNTHLFQILRKWVRDNTRATPFLVAGERVNVPIRLGKSCFSWIRSHPGLKPLGLDICINC